MKSYIGIRKFNIEKYRNHLNLVIIGIKKCNKIN